MDSAKYVTQHKRIYINIGKKKKRRENRVKCAIKIKCVKQYTENLINNDINRDVQEECANRLYWAYTPGL